MNHPSAPSGGTLTVPPRAVVPGAPTVPARLAAVAALLVALVGAGLGSLGGLDALLGDAGVTVVRGRVELATPSGWTVAGTGVRLPRGGEIRVPDGRATLAVPGGELDLTEGAELVLDEPIRVTAGTALARSNGHVTLGAGAVTATGRGAWRIDGGGPGRIATYRGSAVVTDAADREILLRDLQELRIRNGVADGEPRPYVYTSVDPFDPEYLRDAFAVDDLARALHRGLEADYGSAPQSPDFYVDFDGLDGQLVGALGDVGFTFVGDRLGPPADVLIAAVVTEAVVTRSGLSPQDAADEVRTWRLDGATWGLIAVRWDLSPSDVRAAAERALNRRRAALDAGTATPVVTPAAVVPGTAGAPGEGGAPSDPGSGTPPDAGGGDDPTTPPPPGGEPGPEPESPGPVGTVVDTVNDVVPLEDALGDDATGTVDQTAELVDDVLDGLTGIGSSLGDGLTGQGGGVAEIPGQLGDLVDETAGNVGAVVDGTAATVGGVLGN
jgi:hypothetical protein